MNKFFLILFLFLYTSLQSYAQITPQSPLPKGRILVLGINKNQFDSNVYYLDELATLNDTTPAKVLPLYDHQFKVHMQQYQSDEFDFVAADSADAQRYYSRSMYLDWENRFGESYVAQVSDSIQDRILKQLLNKYKADYLLTINYYNIYKNFPPVEFEPNLSVSHIIHYEVFNFNAVIASAGVYDASTRNSKASAIGTVTQQFAEDLVKNIRLFETATSETELKQKYFLLKESRLENTWGVSITGGWGMPYGGFGGELLKNIGKKLELNAGIGYSYSGFKGGIGARYYLLQYGGRIRPFVGANVIWAGGADYSIGGRVDQQGMQVDPDDVSNFKIKPDGAAHLKVGFRWMLGRQALLLSGGYGFPFKGHEAEFISGKYTALRQSQANRMAVGGPEVGLTYIWYLIR